MIKLQIYKVEVEERTFDVMGYQKHKGEDWHSSNVKFKEVIKQKLEAGNVKIECANGVRKEKRDDPSQKRTIIAKFLNHNDKQKVRECRSRKLQKETIYINENFCEETMGLKQKS